MLRLNRTAALLTALLLLSAPLSQAQAQHDPRQINVLAFEPSTNPDGVLTADPASTLGHLRWSAALWLGYANDPLRVSQDGNTLYKLVHDQVLMDLTFAVGIWHYFEIGVHLPVVLYQSEDGDAALIGGVTDLKSVAVGDFRIAPKVRFWKNTRHGFGLALVPQLTIPSGMSAANSTDGRVGFEPKVVLDYRFQQGTLIALNVGYRLRKQVQVSNLRVDDEFYYALGAEIPVWRKQLSVLAEFFGAVGFKDSPLDDDDGLDPEEAPLEAALALRYRAPFGLVVTGGVGVGITSGYGSPDYRLFLGVGYRSPVRAKATTKSDPDRDGDGIPNEMDRCPADPEDKDGFQDQDGCPDPDNDKDGVCDPSDAIQKRVRSFAAKCRGTDLAPNDPEDKDGFQDEDGRPEPDNDGDGVCDPNQAIQSHLQRYAKVCKGKDVAPNDPEDRDGFQDQDGTPDPDNDRDGVCDPHPVIQQHRAKYVAVCKGSDKAPLDREDRDGFQDEDGVPDPDNDQDGFCDNNPTIQDKLAAYKHVCKGKDKCPDKKEIINGVKDDDGCPDKGKPKLIITRKNIRILDKVYFRTNRATIMAKSFPILRIVAKVLKSNEWIERVRVEGHTDERGRDSRNLNLSQARSEAVKAFLVKQGVAAARLDAKGYGETKPIQAGCRKLRRYRERRTCWAKNRRVAFTILKTARAKPPGTTVKTRPDVTPRRPPAPRR